LSCARVFKSLQQFLKTELLGKVVDLNLVTALEHVTAVGILGGNMCVKK